MVDICPRDERNSKDDFTIRLEGRGYLRDAMPRNSMFRARAILVAQGSARRAAVSLFSRVFAKRALDAIL